MSGKAKAETPEKLFSDIERFIADGQALLERGALMDLKGLDAQVMLLCEEVLMLSQNERRQHADKLQQLLNGLAAFGQALEARRDLIGGEIQSVSQHKKASTAYRVAEASDKKGEG